MAARSSILLGHNVSLSLSLQAVEPVSLCIFGEEDESGGSVSAVLYATFNSFIYVFVLGCFELAYRHSCKMFVSPQKNSPTLFKKILISM